MLGQSNMDSCCAGALNTFKKALLYKNIRFQLILFNVTSKTQYTRELQNNTVTTGLM
jgi:hypothetical protein